MKQAPITLDTLGALADYRYQLTGHCRGCNRHVDPELQTLVARLGAGSRTLPARCH